MFWPLLELLVRHISIHSLGHLRTRYHLVGAQLQERTQGISHNLGLVEPVVLGTSLLLLTGRVVNVSQDLADHLAQSLQVLLYIRNLESDGVKGGPFLPCLRPISLYQEKAHENHDTYEKKQPEESSVVLGAIVGPNDIKI
jgi:hypothetical protein